MISHRNHFDQLPARTALFAAAEEERTVIFSLLNRLLDVEFSFSDELRIPRVVRPASNFEDSFARGTGRDDRSTERMLRQSFLEFDASGRDIGPLRRARRHGRSGEDSSLVRHYGRLGRELLFPSMAVFEDFEPELCVPFRLLPSALDRVGPLLVQAVRYRTVRVLFADAHAVGEVLGPQHDDDERPEEAFLRRRRWRGRPLDHGSAQLKASLSTRADLRLAAAAAAAAVTRSELSEKRHEHRFSGCRCTALEAAICVKWSAWRYAS